MNGLSFKPRIATRDLRHWANRYHIQDDERRIEHEVAPMVRAQGFYEKEEFLAVCGWRSPRGVARCRPNDPDVVRAATRIALSEGNERIRIGVLRLLRGVHWPAASVLLHFGHVDPYPIMDLRVLWSLGAPSISASSIPLYSFDLWWAFVQLCRTLSDESGLSMRGLDRALWQYWREYGRTLSLPE